METLKESPLMVGAESGEALSVVGDSYRIIISGKQTNGAYAVIEMLVPPNGGPGPHAHALFQESFYVMEGEIELKSEAGNFTATKGSYVNIPLGGIVHCFKNNSDKMARLLCTVVPSGLEEFFEEIGQPASFGTFIPMAPITPDAMKKLKEIAEKHGQQLFPPDYLD